MKTTSPARNNDFRFSRNPEVWKSEIESHLLRLKQNDDTAKEPLLDFIDHRLNRRYIQPLLNITPCEFKSGFLIMAAACLAIEALQSFYEGLDNTNRASGQAFDEFFNRNKKTFPGFRQCFPVTVLGGKTIDTFYTHIRCGILHQAETTGGYSILRDGSDLFDKNEKSIEADKFLIALQDCLKEYIKDLRASPCNSLRWDKAAKKIGHICVNCIK